MNEEYRKKLEKIKQELLIMKTLNIKPNYSELSRIYKIDRRTIKKYNNGYCRENIKIIRKSKLDNLKNEIKFLKKPFNNWYLQSQNNFEDVSKLGKQ